MTSDEDPVLGKWRRDVPEPDRDAARGEPDPASIAERRAADGAATGAGAGTGEELPGPPGPPTSGGAHPEPGTAPRVEEQEPPTAPVAGDATRGWEWSPSPPRTPAQPSAEAEAEVVGPEPAEAEPVETEPAEVEPVEAEPAEVEAREPGSRAADGIGPQPIAPQPIAAETASGGGTTTPEWEWSPSPTTWVEADAVDAERADRVEPPRAEPVGPQPIAEGTEEEGPPTPPGHDWSPAGATTMASDAVAEAQPVEVGALDEQPIGQVEPEAVDAEPVDAEPVDTAAVDGAPTEAEAAVGREAEPVGAEAQPVEVGALDEQSIGQVEPVDAEPIEPERWGAMGTEAEPVRAGPPTAEAQAPEPSQSEPDAAVAGTGDERLAATVEVAAAVAPDVGDSEVEPGDEVVAPATERQRVVRRTSRPLAALKLVGLWVVLAVLLAVSLGVITLALTIALRGAVE